VDEARERGVALTLPVAAPHRSPTVTCVALPPGTASGPVVSELKRRGFVIGAGYGKLKDAQLRIGHMGDHTVEELDQLLDELLDVLLAVPAAAAAR
jgi:aspartate aminotransferase-like enzyme